MRAIQVGPVEPRGPGHGPPAVPEQRAGVAGPLLGRGPGQLVHWVVRKISKIT